MLPLGVLGSISDRSGRFTLVGLLPVTVFTVFVYCLFAVGDPPSWHSLETSVAGIGDARAVFLTLGVVWVALAAQPLQTLLLRMYEGYWAQHPLCPAWLTVAVLERQRRKFGRLQRREDPPKPKPKPQPQSQPQPQRGLMPRLEAALSSSKWADELKRAWDEVGERRRSTAHRLLLQRFPPPGHLQPTALGNALRSAEEEVFDRHGLDAVTLWPTLYPLLSPQLRGAVDDERNLMDFAVRMNFLLGISLLITVARLVEAWSVWWLPVIAALLLLDWATYRTAVLTAVLYGQLIGTAFELHRFDLLTALHLPLPEDSKAERSANTALSMRLALADRNLVHYRHPPAATEQPPAGPAQPPTT